MLGYRDGVLALLTVIAVLLPTRVADAQRVLDVDDAPVQVGPLALWPVFEATNIGYESNVFSQAENPQSDFTATASPALDAWLRLPNGSIKGRADVAFVYFRELTDLQSIDTDASVSAEFALSRLKPYASASRTDVQRRSLELDVPARRLDEAGVIGLDLKLTGKTTIGVSASRSRVAYDTADYVVSNLTDLNRESTGERVRLQYEATPLTTVELEVALQQDRFDYTPERDTERLRVGSVVLFSPLALVRGRLSVGWLTSSSLEAGAPKPGGVYVLGDVFYTLLGRTNLGLQIERDIDYSYRSSRDEYRLAGVRASITHRLAEPWDIGGYVARARITYLTGSVPGAVAPLDEVETMNRYGVEVGFRTGRTRVGVDFRFRQRDAGAPSRNFDGFQLVSSLRYALR